uniref:BZIP domain-containing protein n=1 Tax=Meloidogyne hapla TaxID=6305 RepID=A0A1I8B3D0_MELHA
MSDHEQNHDFSTGDVGASSSCPNECPSFHANIPPSLFDSTILNQSQDVADAHRQLLTATDTGDHGHDNNDFEDKSLTIPEIKMGDYQERPLSLTENEGNLNRILNIRSIREDCPTFRPSIPSSLFVSTIPDNSIYGAGNEQDHDFSTGSVGASSSSPKNFSLRKNKFFLTKRTPCKVRELIRRPYVQSSNDLSPTSSNIEDRPHIDISMPSHAEQTLSEKFLSPPQAKISLVQAEQDIYDDGTQDEANFSQSSDFYHSPSPQHFLHNVCISKPPELTYQPKLIRPDPQSPSVVQQGLRRSKRNRLPALQHHLGQRPIYEVDKDGNRVLVGATEVEPKDNRLKAYGVLDIVTAADKENEAKNFKRRTRSLMKKRRQERCKHELSKVKEEDE